jgi:hypothetical protein
MGGGVAQTRVYSIAGARFFVALANSGLAA